ncbi:MAG TPA: tetratricopeptide repeat protein [Kiritimatiellia bacterium]|nr:tetratricopeptide repeat protein [Kiritimatiellia bacterium]HMO97922.1 tetratricopeptide repeat protein [Kiritimatiellia bacterium]HMP95273.1 tetratricopeptide repeat protein [Kiritimatiellia bacterium]
MAEIEIENAPRKAREHYEKGFASMERGNLEYAMEMFMLSLDVCPQLLKTRKFLRAAQIRKYKTTPPNVFAKALIPIKAAGKTMKAQASIKKDPLAALKVTEELLTLDPFNPQFVHLNVQAATGAGMPEAAILTLEAAKENSPSDVKLLRQLAALYTEVDRMHDARLLYEDIVRLSPNDPQAVKQLKDATALDSMQRGRWNEEGDFRGKIKDSKEAILLEQQGKAVKTAKDADALIEENLKKIEAEPQNINYRRALAELYLKKDQYDQAIEVLKQAQEMTGGADPQIDRALSGAYLKKLDHEIAQFEAAGDTEHAEAWKKEKESFMLDDARDKVERYPNDLLFRFDLAVLLFERGDLNEAIQHLQLAQRNPQKRIRSLYYLGLCFKAKNQNDIALEQLQKAASELLVMDDTKKDILYELGKLSEAMGNREKALSYFKEIYGVDISYRDVSAKIEAFYKKD